MDQYTEEMEGLDVEVGERSIQFNAETGAAVARLVASLAVSVLAVCGWTVDFNLVFNICISVIAVACLVYGLWYKNANLTKAAQTSQKLLNQLKSEDDATDAKKEGTD